MNHYILILSLLLLSHTIITNTAPLDISDYTFHYTTHHYILPPLTTETTTIYNPTLSTNITITFTENISITVTTLNTPPTTLNLLNDFDWDEITVHSHANTHKPTPQKRRLHIDEFSDEKQYEGIPHHGRNWHDANAYCKATRRGHLPQVLDEDENFEIAEECSKLGTRWHCWLGLKRPFQTWITGETVSYTNWLPGEPNNWKGKENCAEIYGTDEQDGFQEMWNDLECSMMRGIICERPPHPQPPPVARKLICDCDDKNLNRPGYLRRRLSEEKGKCGCKPLTKKEVEKRKRQRMRWARIKAYQRHQRRIKQRHRRAKERMRRERARRRRRWRKHLEYLRKKSRSEMERDYKREMRLEKRRDQGYNLLNKLIGSALGMKHSAGAKFGQAQRRRRLYGEYDGYRRRRMVDSEGMYDMISRCVLVRGEEICVNYNFGDMFISVDIKSVERKDIKVRGSGTDFRGHMMDLVKGKSSDLYDDYHVHSGGYQMFDPMEGNLGYAVWKYEKMDWHRFDGESEGGMVEYGEYEKFDDYIHYFEEYELTFNNNEFGGVDSANETVGLEVINEGYIECSDRIGDLPFKMCMKQMRDGTGEKDTVLYFEKESEDKYRMDVRYSFQVKEFVDSRFEESVFWFGEDSYWDEISVVNVEGTDMKWTKKCSFKLLIAKICIEQFHINDSRGSIKFQSKNKYSAAV